MRQEKSIRSNLAHGFMIAVIIPILVMALGSQYLLRIWANDSLQFEINSSLFKAEECLNMTLEKYDTVLYDFCTDDEVVQLIREIQNVNTQIEQSPELETVSTSQLEAAFSQLRRKLSHVANRTDHVEGISLKITNGSIMYYDRIASSSDHTTWAKEVSFPEVKSGEVYQIADQTVKNGGKTVHLFQIARRIVNYENVNESLGIAVLSINSSELTNALKNANDAETYLYYGERIISAPKEELIGASVSRTEKKGYLITDKLNKKSGFILRNLKKLDGYNRTVYGQGIIFFLGIVLSLGIFIAGLYKVTSPIIEWVEKLDDAMHNLSKGKYEIRLPQSKKSSIEMNQINASFNEAVRQTEIFMKQTKVAVVEQKNAELNALEAQIDPHFLYNTLDTINWKAIECEEYEISEMVGALADILRYSVKNAGEEIRISQEVAWLKEYLLLQGRKIGKKLKVRLNIPEEYEGYRIHKLLLQPFIENSLKYGFQKKKEECILEISIQKKDDQMHIIIYDNGQGMTEEQLKYVNYFDEISEHMGIFNVKKRLKLYYGETAQLYFESVKGEFTRVHLFIPAVNGENGADNVVL